MRAPITSREFLFVRDVVLGAILRQALEQRRVEIEFWTLFWEQRVSGILKMVIGSSKLIRPADLTP